MTIIDTHEIRTVVQDVIDRSQVSLDILDDLALDDEFDMLYEDSEFDAFLEDAPDDWRYADEELEFV